MVLFNDLGMFCAISYVASILSNILTVSSKQNVTIDLGLIMFEFAFVLVGLLFNTEITKSVDPAISKPC